MTGRYTVVWFVDARNELAQIWLDAPDRTAVTIAAREIDSRLSRSPSTEGVLLSEGLWALIEPPLQVAYEVREADRVVEVAFVKRV